MKILVPFLIQLLATAAFGQSTHTGKVVGVHDGDTFSLIAPDESRYKIRLAGVDAPERKQDYGPMAMEYLAKLILGKEVTFSGRRNDGFGQRLAKVTLNGRDIALEMVIAGLAWQYKTTAEILTDKERHLYTSAEINARRAQLNIWTDPKPTPPWEFRAKEPVLAAVEGKIIGNRINRIFHRPGCPGYRRVSPTNRLFFDSEKDAEAAGFRSAKNCPAEPQQ